MRFKFYFLFIFYTLLFLFYPGDTHYFHIFAYNRELFSKNEVKKEIQILPVPYLKNPYWFPEITAQGVYVVDLDSFTPILKKNEKEKFLPASLTKIITALVSLDIYQPQQVITIKKVVNEGQVMNLVAGEKITVENLLYGILVHSANDAAFALAENYGYDLFIDLMNKKAQDLKMKNTHFTNPAGFDNPNHYSSPFDLILAARELLNNPYLAKIAATKEIIIPDTEFKYFHRLTNVNQLLGEISGLGGLKTGYTQEAGQNLITFYKKNGHQYLITLLKSEDRFLDTKQIIEWINLNVDYLSFK
jgi:D-alanyl-D-alanine carboxypeptidase